MNHLILVDLTERILTIRFNRPEKKNALNKSMYAALADAIVRAQENDEVRVILLAGQTHCFTSGNDLSDPPDGLTGALGRFIDAIMTCSKPVIAAPCGMAVGIGLTMLMYCDLVYCGEQTTLRTPFVNLGVCPELGSSYVLPQMMGHQRACALLLTGDAINATQAREYGLVNEVLPNADVEAFARSKARVIAAQAPQAVRTTKMLMRRWNLTLAKQANKLEMEHLMSMVNGAEVKEAILAFGQKRPPDFSTLV
jgi:enoyl-CoA hydratase/carnithine racemase